MNTSAETDYSKITARVIDKLTKMNAEAGNAAHYLVINSAIEAGDWKGLTKYLKEKHLIKAEQFGEFLSLFANDPYPKLQQFASQAQGHAQRLWDNPEEYFKQEAPTQNTVISWGLAGGLGLIAKVLVGSLDELFSSDGKGTWIGTAIGWIAAIGTAVVMKDIIQAKMAESETFGTQRYSSDTTSNRDMTRASYLAQPEHVSPERQTESYPEQFVPPLTRMAGTDRSTPRLS